MESNVIAVRQTCRVCEHSPLLTILSLGDLYISDFLDREESGKLQRAPLELTLCSQSNGGCGLVQLRHTVSHESLYRNYWYRSGVNQTMIDELRSITSRAKEIIPLGPGDLVVDIGSNDGTLLRSYEVPGLNLIGFEPARNIVEKYGCAGLTKVFPNFFNFGEWQKEFGDSQAKVVTAIAMFYDLEDPNAFVANVARCLDPEGLFIIQMAYLPLALERNAFDGICHEHLEFYSLLSLENLLKRHGLEVFDVELRDINEGSFRVYIRHQGVATNVSGGRARLINLREREKKIGLSEPRVYKDFVRRVEEVKNRVHDFIANEVKAGKRVYVYGASTKGNTLLQFFNLDRELITAAAERNPDKWGKKTVGTNIPIISEEAARQARPDYFLILPWHFLKEFKEREQEFLNSGGKFIVPLPEFKIIDGGN